MFQFCYEIYKILRAEILLWQATNCAATIMLKKMASRFVIFTMLVTWYLCWLLLSVSIDSSAMCSLEILCIFFFWSKRSYVLDGSISCHEYKQKYIYALQGGHCSLYGIKILRNGIATDWLKESSSDASIVTQYLVVFICQHRP